MSCDFKRVPALDKCFNILGFFARSNSLLGVSEVSNALGYNRSTVYNILRTLADLGIVEQSVKSKFALGTQLYALGASAARDSQLLNVTHPFLEDINRKTKLSSFLSILSKGKSVIVDKVDSQFDIKVSTEIGMKHPILAAAVGRALLSQMSDSEIEKLLSRRELKKYTPLTCLDKVEYKRMIQKVREEGIAISKGEFIEGLSAIAAPINVPGQNLLAAIWVIGLESQINNENIIVVSNLLKKSVESIQTRLSLKRLGAR